MYRHNSMVSCSANINDRGYNMAITKKIEKSEIIENIVALVKFDGHCRVRYKIVGWCQTPNLKSMLLIQGAKKMDWQVSGVTIHLLM